MSAIGGIFDTVGREIDVAELDAMRIAMSLRGGGKGSAYLGGCVGMLHSASRKGGGEEQPAIFERRSGVFALSFDSDSLLSAALFEKYRVHGVDVLGQLSGGFALALYDGERRMLVLARDRRGRVPLFYRIYKGRLYYASEIKGLYAATKDAISVSKEMLSLHVSAPTGVYRATNILPDVREVLPGECLLFTSLGMSRFRYREAEKHQKGAQKSRERQIYTPMLAPPAPSISEVLSSALLCFDYPQFDAEMPRLFGLFAAAEREGKDEFFYEDGTRTRALSYALEREDRLGALYGVRGVGVPSREERDESAISDLHRRLLCRLLSLDSAEREILKSILGQRKLELLMRRFEKNANTKKDTDGEVGILGMLCQCVLWAESRELCLKSGAPSQSLLSIT